MVSNQSWAFAIILNWKIFFTRRGVAYLGPGPEVNYFYSGNGLGITFRFSRTTIPKSQALSNHVPWKRKQVKFPPHPTPPPLPFLNWCIGLWISKNQFPHQRSGLFAVSRRENGRRVGFSRPRRVHQPENQPLVCISPPPPTSQIPGRLQEWDQKIRGWNFSKLKQDGPFTRRFGCMATFGRHPDFKAEFLPVKDESVWFIWSVQKYLIFLSLADRPHF